MPEPLLALDGLGKQFGGVQAFRDLSFHVGEAEIVGLIGPNGSGKSTSVNLISGTLPPTAGDIRFAGDSVSRLSGCVPSGSEAACLALAARRGVAVRERTDRPGPRAYGRP